MKNPRPQILYLVHRVPYPPNRGDRIRSFHILDFLSKRADVHLATLADETVSNETMQALHKRCKQVAVERLSKTRWLRGGAGLVCGRPATEGLFWSPQVQRTLRNWAAHTHFDAAVVFCSSMVQYLSMPELRDVPAIVDLVDVDSQKWLDYSAASRGLKRFLFRVEGGRIRRLEAAACRRASSIVLVSQAEADLFRRVCPNDRTHGIPNGVDLEYFHYVSGEGRPGRCVFVGALDYRANIDGICWFCREVWPQIHRTYPGATLAIVGRNPVPDVDRLRTIPGVEVAASVPDVRPYLAEASVVVAPLRIARGIQNKVLEAMASGRAVVASREALEGLDVRSGEHVVMADSARHWADEISRLLNRADERARLGRSGREFVLEHHEWQKCLALYERLLFRHSPAGCDPTAETRTSVAPEPHAKIGRRTLVQSR